MENAGWAGGMPGEKGMGEGGPDYHGGPEGANSVEGPPDVNYMYGGAQTGHNGAGAGDGY